MKVICAGHSKTGTKSMCAALRELGYEVYDFLDHFWFHYYDWMKILSSGSGGRLEDFKRMYKDVDAITGGPAMLMWEEIHKAFPDAKIILTCRDEDIRTISLRNQLKAFKSDFLYGILQCLTPTGRRYYRFFKTMILHYYGLSMKHPFDLSYGDNEMILRKSFRRHQAYCLENAPKDKFLAFQVSEGWEPLCKFLEKEIPNKPFPRENIGGTLIKKMKAVHPSMLRMQNELRVIICLFVVACSLCLKLLFF